MLRLRDSTEFGPTLDAAAERLQMPDQLFAALELEEEQENRAGTDGISADEPRPKKAG